MKHKSTPILEVHVETNPEGTVMLTSEIGSVKMIPFKGTVTGPIFNGIVEPVSYTHLDVYKRQYKRRPLQSLLPWPALR